MSSVENEKGKKTDGRLKGHKLRSLYSGGRAPQSVQLKLGSRCRPWNSRNCAASIVVDVGAALLAGDVEDET